MPSCVGSPVLRHCGDPVVRTRCEDDALTVLGAVFLPEFAPERLYDLVRAADAAGGR
jgi:hypothetical protein